MKDSREKEEEKDTEATLRERGAETEAKATLEIDPERDMTGPAVEDPSKTGEEKKEEKLLQDQV